MRPKTITFTMAAADRNGVCLAQTPLAAGALTINGALASSGVATMDVARHLTVYGVGDESGKTFTFTGTDRLGNSITEAVTGPTAGATVSTTKNFKTCSQVTIDAAGAGNIEIGTGNSAESQWIPVDYIFRTPDCIIKTSDGASMTTEARGTVDNPWDAGFDEAEAHDIALTESDFMRAVRLEVSDFVSGTATMTVLQGRV